MQNTRSARRCLGLGLFLVSLGAPWSISAQTLQELWGGQAAFSIDQQNGPFGSEFGMHFLSVWWDGSELEAYYIANYTADGVGRSVTGLATSRDGIVFVDQGVVMDIGGAWQWVYAADGDLEHAIGRADSGGWSADVALDAAGHLCYGPYATDIGPGPNTASFALLVDNNSADNDVIVTIDVFDATEGKILATRDVRRDELAAPYEEQVFNLDYTQEGGHATELRTYWHDRAYVRQRLVSVSQGQAPFFDDRLASFPGVWKDGGTYYLVYEGAGTSGEWPGDVGLATSTDGIHWIKDASNPILVHQSAGWESVNIGTPSLWKEDGLWYLFYHGFDGDDVQIGVATGPDLYRLTRYAGNPIVPVGPSDSWDAGTAGKRTLWKESNDYYMAYEGSTDPPYDTAQWSTGLARSQDLLNWDKFPGNPVLPQTEPGTGFGFDGPEFIRTPDGQLHIYYRQNGPGNLTMRATLVESRDADQDGVDVDRDNCPSDYNPAQEDDDGDGLGDACDCAPGDPTEPGDDGACAPACGGARGAIPLGTTAGLMLAGPSLLFLWVRRRRPEGGRLTRLATDDFSNTL